MKRILLLLAIFAVSSTIFAQSTKSVSENPGKNTSWSKSESLVYEKTLNGETWYNPSYPTEKGEIKDEWRIYKKFNLRPQAYDDRWSFSLDIWNLNNQDEFYFNPATPSKTVRRSDIAWGFGIGLLVEQDTFHIMVLIRCVDTVYRDGSYRDGSKGKVNRYTIYDGNHWSEWRNIDDDWYGYKTLRIETNATYTSLRWGYAVNRGNLLSFPKHCDGISYVEFEVLPQSKLIVGDASLTYEIIEKQVTRENSKSAGKPKLTK